MGSLRFVLGGARGGKSRFAERLAHAEGRNVIYVATAEVTDAEMAARIARHRRDRPAHWRTLETPRDLPSSLAALPPTGDTVLIDCLSVWLSNELLFRLAPRDDGAADTIAADAAVQLESELLTLVEALAGWALNRPGATIVVSNEVGAGVVPAYALGRLYRDVLGRANQAIAAHAQAVYLVVAGIGVDLRRFETRIDESGGA